MSFGSVLLRPQVLTVTAPEAKVRPVGAFFELFKAVADEVRAEGPGLTIIEEELSVSLSQLAVEVAPRLEAAGPKITGLFDPIVGFVEEAFGEAAEAGDDFDAVAATAATVMEAVAAALQAMTVPKIRGFLEDLFDIIEDDLGLDDARFRQILRDTIDRIITRLQTAPATGGHNTRALGQVLQELRDAMAQDLRLPAISKNTVLPPIVDLLEQSNFLAKVSDAAGLATRAGLAFTPLATLQQFSVAVSVRPRTLGAAAVNRETCFYASWLNNRVVKADDCTDNFDLAQVHFKREHLSAGTMEDIAFHTRWAFTLLEGVFHATSLEKGDFVANLVNILWHVAEFGATMGKEIIPTWLKWVLIPTTTFFAGFERARFNDMFGLTLIGADLAETQLYARWVWLLREALISIMTLANNDAERWAAFVTAAEREATTEALKAELARVKRIHNHNQIEGVAHLFGEFGTFLVPLILSRTDKENFGFPDGGGSWGRVVGYFIATWLSGLIFTYLAGGLLTRAISGTWADGERILRLYLKDRIFGRFEGGAALALWDVIAKGIIIIPATAIVDHFIYYYLLTEGNTDGGRFSARTDAAGNEITYPGYPNRGSSPYLLPWPQGELMQCAQGNLGIWSHTPFSNRSQLYAYDFSHNDGDDILAMRDGVVWAYQEDVPDGESNTTGTLGSRANRIHVMHPTVPSPAPTGGNLHDFDQNGNPNRTIAEYLHGKQNSVTDAFRERGIEIGLAPASSLVGTPVEALFNAQGIDLTVLGGAQVPVEMSAPPSDPPATPVGPLVVQQGQVIMYGDDTGRSAYNHLHIHVRPAVLDASGNPLNPNNSTGAQGYTIPFVYADADVEGDDGVPRSLDWYDSDNEKMS